MGNIGILQDILVGLFLFLLPFFLLFILFVFFLLNFLGFQTGLKELGIFCFGIWSTGTVGLYPHARLPLCF